MRPRVPAPSFDPVTELASMTGVVAQGARAPAVRGAGG